VTGSVTMPLLEVIYFPTTPVSCPESLSGTSVGAKAEQSAHLAPLDAIGLNRSYRKSGGCEGRIVDACAKFFSFLAHAGCET